MGLSRFALAFLALILTACFDYEEDLTIQPSGELTANVSYLAPEWLRELPQMRDLLFPTTVTELTRKLGSGIEIVEERPGLQPMGFKGRLATPALLDTKLVKHRLSFLGGGRYTYETTLEVPAGFVQAVSNEVDQRITALPRMTPGKAAKVRAASLAQFGFRFKVTLPGEITQTDGLRNGHTVAWKVPVDRFFATNRVVLKADGQMSLFERMKRRYQLLTK